MQEYLRVLGGMGFAVALCLLAGCLVTHGSDTTYKGTRVDPQTFDQIKVGSTTEGWVQSTLGSPTSVSHNDKTEVWKYTYTEHTDEHGAIFLVFGGSDSTEKSETVFVEFKDGIVINKGRG
jgi:outer membrane protein assembly factor BamE (lipoprotein component of BamABCDE complex)